MKIFKDDKKYKQKTKNVKKTNVIYVSKLGKGTSSKINGVVEKKGVKKSLIQRFMNVIRSVINVFRFKKKVKPNEMDLYK
jgi:hypothetical protein